MYALKALVFLASLLVFVEAGEHRVNRGAHRRHHARGAGVNRRSTCPKRTVSSSAVSATAASASVVASSTHVSSSAVASSSKAASTKAATSSAVSSSSSHASSTATKSSSSEKASATSNSLSSSLLTALFPVDTVTSWTTSSSSKDALTLSDSTLKPFKVLSALSHKYVQQDGKTAMHAHYPKGSFNFQHTPLGGISFYAPGPDSLDITTAKELTFGYSVFFDSDFDFNKGGKLPGIYGGNSADKAISCSGGRRDDACFSARLMWRTDGAGEMYTYLPPSYSANDNVCNVAPFSECNPTYGASVGRGSFKFNKGDWTTVSERIKLNDVGKENGELELFVGGKSVLSATGLVLRDSSAGVMRGIQMQTFFGGSDSSWASPKDQDVYFADFSMAITEKL
ncbi:hypothetical protein PUNSTDRAFT_88685 [Punctularia strigosozonata HHB-11173 SS5]|uniref:uncharacterized protein n=1 Tax=Punctularia strigosozonata (strain HHB-11173) TaxID=741275 RepID=UPI00044181D5|nr:uncharacterized protein PUNSTDRAFT_88685 [Punctularia strigosozonata HHB-11173 SS5]EIN07957.1 hypothetical protein PUNSTDRAFT_88685 [Punctularia strigosozonata HHB-11173 SS5]